MREVRDGRLQIVEPTTFVSTLTHPFGPPWCHLIIESNTGEHRRDKFNRRLRFSIDVVGERGEIEC